VRIVYLHQYFNTPAMVGGTRSYETARRFVAMGHEVHIVTSRRDGSPSAGGRHWVRTREDGIDVHWLPVPYSNSMGHRERLRAFARFAWSAGSKAASLGGNVIFATSTPLTIALPAVRAARWNRIPMVLEVRDLWPEVPIAMGALRGPVSIAAAHWLERFAYRHAARIVALSPEMRAGIVRAGYPAERVSVIPNACDVELFDVGPEPGRALRQRHAWLQDRPLVLYAGTLGPLNGACYLARLAAEIAPVAPDVRFVVIGTGKEERLIRTTAARLGVLKRSFFMLPSLPKTEIPAWMSAADITMSTVTDRRELWANSANKVFDSFAAAKPIAINHEGWLADLLRETSAGLVLHAQDFRSAATRLLAALGDRQWLARAATAGRSLAQGRFHRDQQAAQLEAVLREAVGEVVEGPRAWMPVTRVPSC
jgi:glycosyltransferase involved in cell wall biosynthesis